MLRNVVLISYRVWQDWFGGDDGVIGRSVQVKSQAATIIGVMPPGFYFRNRDVDLWTAMNLDPARDYRKDSGRYLMSVASLMPGVTRDRAQSQMAVIAGRIEAEHPQFNTHWTVNVEPLRDSLVSEVKTSMLVVLGAVGLLLAVACANVANLLLGAVCVAPDAETDGGARGDRGGPRARNPTVDYGKSGFGSGWRSHGCGAGALGRHGDAGDGARGFIAAISR